MTISSENIREEKPATKLRLWIGVPFLLVLVAIAVAYMRRHAYELLSLVELRPAFLLPALAAEATLLFLRGQLSRLLCRAFDVELGHEEATALAAWTTAANYLTPFVGGAGVRAWYLRKRHGLPLTSFVSVHAASYSYLFIASGALGLCSVALLPELPRHARLGLGAFFAFVVVACLLFHSFPFRFSTGRGRLATLLSRLADGWRRLQRVSRPVIVALLVVYVLTQAGSVWAAFGLLGLKIAPAEAIFLAALTSFSMLLNITPGALGITESILVFGSALLGAPRTVAIAAAVLRRFLSLTVTLLGAAWSQLYLLKRTKGAPSGGG